MNLEQQWQLAQCHYERGDKKMCRAVTNYMLCRDPNHSRALGLMGMLMHQDGDNGAAINLFMRSVEQDDKMLYSWMMLGSLLLIEGQQMAAQGALRQCIAMKNDDYLTWAHYAASWINWGTPDSVINAADQSLHHKPGNAPALYHKALGLMEKSQWPEGFKLYEHRYDMPDGQTAKRPYAWAKWDGKPVGKLLVHGEQGLGDEIMFLGWLKDVPAESLVLEVTPRLVETVRRTWPDATVISDPKEAMGDANVVSFAIDGKNMVSSGSEGGMPVDAWCAMGSLPHLRGVESRWTGAYMKPCPVKVAAYRARMEALGPGPYIGLSWSGGRIATHGHLRNADIEQWKPIAAMGTCISVQYGPMGALAAELGIPHWIEDPNAVDDLFALIAACDLIVSVNNTTVHMAGSMGVPCWTLTPSRPAWRYHQTGERMQWYDSVRQYRQVGDNWGPTYHRVAADLVKFVARKEAA